MQWQFFSNFQEIDLKFSPTSLNISRDESLCSKLSDTSHPTDRPYQFSVKKIIVLDYANMGYFGPVEY